MLCDEGWDVDEPTCPCAEQDSDGNIYCRLRMTIIYPDEADICPHANALKAIVKYPELILVAMTQGIRKIFKEV